MTVRVYRFSDYKERNELFSERSYDLAFRRLKLEYEEGNYRIRDEGKVSFCRVEKRTEPLLSDRKNI